jgi:hypothetical protein
VRERETFGKKLKNKGRGRGRIAREMETSEIFKRWERKRE